MAEVVSTHTVTLTREDGSVLTCTMNTVTTGHMHKGSPLKMLVVDKVVNAEGNEVQMTQWEEILCFEAVKAKRTEARWDDDV